MANKCFRMLDFVKRGRPRPRFKIGFSQRDEGVPLSRIQKFFFAVL